MNLIFVFDCLCSSFHQSALGFLQDSSKDGIQRAASEVEPHDPSLPLHVLGPQYTPQVLPQMVCNLQLLGFFAVICAVESMY